MTGPAPTIHVFGRAVWPDGSQGWLRYVAVGDDHQAAATLAVRAWSGNRLEELVTFAGEPERWLLGATPAPHSTVRPA